jgi:hypothetical protein
MLAFASLIFEISGFCGIYRAAAAERDYFISLLLLEESGHLFNSLSTWFGFNIFETRDLQI